MDQRGKMGVVLKMFFFSFTKKPFFAKPTIEEVMIFGVSEVPTVPVEEVKKFLKHIALPHQAGIELSDFYARVWKFDQGGRNSMQEMHGNQTKCM